MNNYLDLHSRWKIIYNITIIYKIIKIHNFLQNNNNSKRLQLIIFNH
jgi:hypothetical protein